MYDRQSWVYDVWSVVAESRALRRALELGAPQPHESVLEVAVGTGWLFQELVRNGHTGWRVGVELSPRMLARTRRRARSANGSEPLLARADARALPFASGTFDLVLNCYMVDMMSDADVLAVLTEFRRVTRPTGRLVLVVMAQQRAWVEALWMSVYRAAPSLVGGCLPVEAAPLVERAGWRVERQECVSQNAFRSELTLARSPARSGE